METVPSFDLWLEFEHWKPRPDDDPYDNFFNMQVKLADGRTYALNVWTFKFLDRARKTQGLESKRMAGKYVVGPDLFVEKLDRTLLEDVVADLLATEQMKPEWLCSGD